MIKKEKLVREVNGDRIKKNNIYIYNIYIYIYIYMYIYIYIYACVCVCVCVSVSVCVCVCVCDCIIQSSPVKPESGIIRSGQKSHSTMNI